MYLLTDLASDKMSFKRKISAPIKYPGIDIDNTAAAFGGNYHFDLYRSPVISMSGSDEPTSRRGTSALSVVTDDDYYSSCSSTSSPTGHGHKMAASGLPSSKATKLWPPIGNNNIELGQVTDCIGNSLKPSSGNGTASQKNSGADHGIDVNLDGNHDDTEPDDDDVMESVKAVIGSASSVDDKQRLLSVMISQLQSLKENLVTQKHRRGIVYNNGVNHFKDVRLMSVCVRACVCVCVCLAARIIPFVSLRI